MDNPCDTILVCVIDDDELVRSSLDSLLRSVGYSVLTFGLPQEYKACEQACAAACLLLDIHLQDANGLQFQQELLEQENHIPVILMTGFGDIPTTVRGMRAGAVNFITKPFEEGELLDAVKEAAEIGVRRQQANGQDDCVRRRYAALTPREKEVVALVTAGLLNKQIAARLGLSEITVKIHRGNMMRKMEAESLADLVRMAEQIGVREKNAKRYTG